MKSLLFACSKKFLLVIFTFFYNEVRDGFYFLFHHDSGRRFQFASGRKEIAFAAYVGITFFGKRE